MKTQAAKSAIVATLLTALALPVFAQNAAAPATAPAAAPAAAATDAAPKAKTSHAKHKAAKKAEKKDAAGADAKPATDAAKTK